MNRTVPVFFASSRDCSETRDAVPPIWKVRIVSCVPGSPIDCAAITPVASPSSTRRPEAAFRFAGEHRANLHPFNAGCLNRASQFFRDLLVNVHYHVAVVVLDFLERYAANDAVAQRLDNLTRFHDTGDVNAIHRSAIVFADDDVLSHVNQTTG